MSRERLSRETPAGPHVSRPLRGPTLTAKELSVTVTTSRLIPGLFGLAEEERPAQEMTSCLGGKSLELWVGPPGRLRKAERKHFKKTKQRRYLERLSPTKHLKVRMMFLVFLINRK